MSSDLTPEQLLAIQEFADRYGRGWKFHLRTMWSDGYSMVERQTGKTHLLQQVRNKLGVSWLETFKLPK